MNIHQRIAELTDLAKTCAQDGRFYTAANRLRELADELDAHIDAIMKTETYSGRKARIEAVDTAVDKRFKDRNRRDALKRAGIKPDD
jgi:hypothetical protein